MSRHNLLGDLEKLLKRKRGKAFYASKLGLSIEEVEELLQELKDNKETTYYVHTEGVEISPFETTSTYNLEKGTVQFTSVTSTARTLEELMRDHKVDKEKFKVSNYWSKQKGDKFYHSLFLTSINAESEEVFQEDFIDFLKDFKPGPAVVKYKYKCKEDKPNVCLVLPKQDAHYNKYDISGDNDINKRFEVEEKTLLSMVSKALTSNTLDEVVYIIGSDQFNSEWTSLTTKGTPQQNILTHQDSFQAICNHEIRVITNLLHYSNRVRVMFIAGNHDEFVGWHLVHWLQSYFRDNNDIAFDISTVNTKYHKYGNSAIMLNHGDAIKPKELAHKFPIGFKDRWSECDNYYIFTGDKHVELSLDIHGIKFYQVPQLSDAKSKWDDKQGYIDSKAEMTAFVITEDNGMSDIYKTLL